jgi:hypothetical protein
MFNVYYFDSFHIIFFVVNILKKLFLNHLDLYNYLYFLLHTIRITT